jgi:HD superfamily phosphohydrolase YqeK
LIMTVATANYMRANFRTAALTRCWRHTLATAVLCRELARAVGLPEDRAYSFGLLHDIGRLGLLVKYPDTYDEILADADRDSVSLLDLEQKQFGMDHCEAGRVLVERWKLPREFWIATGRHHDPPEGGPVDTLTLVYLACQLSDTLGYAVVAPLKPMPFAEAVAMLPRSAQERLPDAERLQELVDSALGDDHTSEPVEADRLPRVAARAVEADPEPPPAEEPQPELFRSIDLQPVRYCAVIFITAALVVALTAGIVWISGS